MSCGYNNNVAADEARREYDNFKNNVAGIGRIRRCDFVFECLIELLEDALEEDNNNKKHHCCCRRS